MIASTLASTSISAIFRFPRIMPRKDGRRAGKGRAGEGSGGWAGEKQVSGGSTDTHSRARGSSQGAAARKGVPLPLQPFLRSFTVLSAPWRENVATARHPVLPGCPAPLRPLHPLPLRPHPLRPLPSPRPRPSPAQRPCRRRAARATRRRTRRWARRAESGGSRAAQQQQPLQPLPDRHRRQQLQQQHPTPLRPTRQRPPMQLQP